MHRPSIPQVGDIRVFDTLSNIHPIEDISWCWIKCRAKISDFEIRPMDRFQCLGSSHSRFYLIFGVLGNSLTRERKRRGHLKRKKRSIRGAWSEMKHIRICP